MNLIIDTNVLVSAIFRDKLPEKLVLSVIANPGWQWLASEEILDEYRKVIARPKFSLPEEIIEQWFTIFIDQITLVESFPSSVCFERDPKDAKFPTCALATQADFPISGDTDFSEARKFGNTQIVSVRQFADRFIS